MGRKILRDKGTRCRQQDEDGVFWTWQAYCTHEFTVAATKCMKLSQPKSEWMGETHSVPLLAQGILAVDGYCQRESEFSSGIWETPQALVDGPCNQQLATALSEFRRF